MLVHERQVLIPSSGRTLEVDLAVPSGAVGLVLLAHGTGSSRQSPRQRHLAHGLNVAGLATLQVDLLTALEEELVARWAHDERAHLERLASRLESAREHARRLPETAQLPQGYLGSGTGAAAVLLSAARRPEGLYALACRGGRTDLVEDILPQVRTPTLLVVAGNDDAGLLTNKRALGLLPGEKSLRLVPGAGPLFDEPGALEDVASLATDWFRAHFRPVSEPQIQGWHDEQGRWV